MGYPEPFPLGQINVEPWEAQMVRGFRSLVANNPHSMKRDFRPSGLSWQGSCEVP